MATQAKRKPHPKRAKTGRPVSLTPERISAIALLVEAGSSPQAATATLFSPGSYQNWIERGETALAFVQDPENDVQVSPDGLLHHPEPDEDLMLSFLRAVMRAGALAYADAEARLQAKNPLEWMTGPFGRTIARLLDLVPYQKRAEVEVNVLTVGTVVDQAFQVLEGDGHGVSRLGPLGKLKELPPPMLGEDGQDGDGKEDGHGQG